MINIDLYPIHLGAKLMQGDTSFPDWLSEPRNQHVAELLWSIKHIEVEVFSSSSLTVDEVNHQKLLDKLENCTSLYQQLAQYYPPVETLPTTDLSFGNEQTVIVELWQQQSSRFKQLYNSDERATCITVILHCLNKLILLQKQSPSSQMDIQGDQSLSLEQLSKWFLSFIDLIRHRHDNPTWANDFFKQLSADAYKELYQMLTHTDTSHLMFHIYYYKLFPDQLSPHSKHPDFLISLDQRLSYLYQCIEQFVETFILFSKSFYQLSPKDCLCHGNQLPKGITLRSKETYRQLIIRGLKKLNSKVTITEQTPTAEIIDAIFRSYQFWFNPCRLLDAIFMLCKSLHLSTNQLLGTTLYQHMINAFDSLETDACIHLYGYFSNNDTRYLLRVLDFISHGGNLAKLPPLTEAQRQLINFLYQSFTQIIDAVSENLNARNLPCNAIKVTQSSKPPNPSKRNLQAILHVIATYSDSTATVPNLDSLFAEIENESTTSS